MANYRPGLADVDLPEALSPRFECLVKPIGFNVAVDIPVEVSSWFGETGHIAVEGLLDGQGIRATLVPLGEGRHRMFLNREMRDATGIQLGDRVQLVLWNDRKPRGPDIPEDVRSALEAAGVLDRFQSWSPSHQREYLVVIEDAKREETRVRRIESTIEQLTS